MNCSICGQPLNVPGDARTDDCGGDCVSCMAASGDPSCIVTMDNYNTTLHGMGRGQVELLVPIFAKLVDPGVWEVPYWIDILRDSARRP